jgi:hypothetical protein
MLHDAVPEARLTAVHPVIATPPALNATVPVGVPPVDDTVATMLKDCPKVLEVAEAVSVVVVAAAVTVCARAADVLALWVVLPAYSAVIEWLPIASVLTRQEAAPEPSASALQPVMVVPPSLKVTEPVGVPEVEATVAVKVKAAPKVLVVAAADKVVVDATGFTVCGRPADVLVACPLSPE